MGWDIEEDTTTKEHKKIDTSFKVLIGIMACVIFIIILITILLLNIKLNTFNIMVNGEVQSNYSESLFKKIDGMTYIDIEKFANLVGYEYHDGEEYKAFTKEKDKCYVKGKEETASFYLNDNKICKLEVDKITEEYKEYKIDNNVKKIENKVYAPIDAIKIGFNVAIEEKEKSLEVYTLDGLVTIFNLKVTKWGYSSISEQDFENRKSLLYGFIIVKKADGLYKIINTDNTTEIVSDKYNSIQFIENTKEFSITNSLNKVGIINLDGTTKIEPIYDSIKVLDKTSDLYLIEQEGKYGVIKSGNVQIISPEYEKIGIDSTESLAIENQYLLLDTLIPVYKDNKYGAFDKEGNLVYKLEYDGFGCNISTVEIDGINKTVAPVLIIKRCNGIVVKKGEKYGLINLKGKYLVPASVNSIYSVEDEEENVNYFMLYNSKELNIIERLIAVGLIKEEIDSTYNSINNEISNDNTLKTNNLVN